MAENAIITMDLTRAGFELYGKINAGLTPLHITRVVIGDGYLAEGETIYDLAAVKHEVNNITVQIVNVENLGSGTSRMLIRITGQNEDFYLREIAVMAEDPDNGEIMYSGCNYGDMADYVMTYAGAAPVMQEGNIYFITGTGELTVEVSHDNASVTHAEFEAHTGDKSNPHNVTAEQIFPDNAATLKTITAQNKTNYDAAATAKHNHENKSVLDTITQILIDKWNSAVSHITNRENPHGVTKSQVGLGNVTNESKSTMFASPSFTGKPTAPTASDGDKSTQLANTEFVAKHTENKNNPHSVSAAQVFPSNSGVLANITQALIDKWNSAHNNAHSHNNKSVLDTITQALIDRWNSAVSHITNTDNPHNVTASDVGLGNVTNESKSTMFASPSFTGTPTAVTPSSGNNSNRIATTAYVMTAIENLKKSIGALNIFDALTSIDIEVLALQNRGHSEYTYYRIACTGCTPKNDEYVKNDNPKYITYSPGNGGIEQFYVCVDPEITVITPVSEITLNSGILTYALENTFPNSSAYIDGDNTNVWRDESYQHEEYAQYLVYNTTIKFNQ